MAGEVVSSTTQYDQEKFLAAKLLARSYSKLVAASLCDKVNMQQGAGLTAYFVRYKRMQVPLATLTEGTDPANSSFTLEQVSVTLDQWGDIITITDRAVLTTKHPLVQQAIELLSDNAARVMDREIQLVWLANSNVQYADGSVTARASITNTMKLSDVIVHKARITMENAGAPARGEPSKQDSTQVEANGGRIFMSAYVAVAGPEVIADIMTPGVSLGTFASVATYGNAQAMYNAEVGTWLGVRWVKTNFIPRFVLLGNKTTAVVSTNAFGTDTPVVTAAAGGSGTLAQSTTYYFKVTRKDLLRGFEEQVSIEHTMSSTGAGGATQYFTFNFSGLTAGYVYNLYFGSATGDSNLKLHTENIAVGTTVTVNAVSASTTTAPANPRASNDGLDPSYVHPIFLFAAEAVSWVGFYGIEVLKTKDDSIIGNVLKLKRAIGYKFFGKAMIRDTTRLLRIECAASY